MDKLPNSLSTQSSMSTTQSASVTKSPTGDQRIRVLKRSEYKQAAACLAEAFQTDEVASYAVDTPDRQHWNAERKWKLHVHVMECLVKAHIMRGMVTCIGPDYDCVAMWMPPGKEFEDFWAQLWSGLLLLRFKLSKEGRFRFYDEFLPLLHQLKHVVLGPDDSDAWYLVYIGAKSGSRGKGYAKALIEHTTKQADDENRKCYLESSNVANLKLYHKLGFESVGRKAVLQRGPKVIEMDIMVREPHTMRFSNNAS